MLPSVFRPHRPWPIWATVAVTVAMAGLVDGLIALFAPVNATSQPPVPFSPPGYVVGGVWLVLFGFMGGALAWLQHHQPQERTSRRLLLLLLLLCATYPAYTLGLRSAGLGLSGAIVVLGLTLLLLLRFRRRGGVTPFRLLLPVALWLCFACYLLVAELRLAA